MLIETRAYGWFLENPGMLLILEPKRFFSTLSLNKSREVRHLIIVSLAATVFLFLSDWGRNNWFGISVFFLNAVGMTCIYSGSVFLFARIILEEPPSFSKVFTICAYASLGPILLSWIPGALWIVEPWKWWLTVIGLGTCMSVGLGKSATVVGSAVGAIYALFRTLLFFI